MTIIKRPAAKQDLIECGSFIALGDPVAADKFFRCSGKRVCTIGKNAANGICALSSKSAIAEFAFLARDGISKLFGILFSTFRWC